MQIQGLLDDGDQDIDRDGDPDLGFDSILGGAIESLDSEVLLDPFEKQFHLPSAAIQIGDRYGRQGKVVCQKHEYFVVL